MNKILITGNSLSKNQFGGVKNFTKKFLENFKSEYFMPSYFSLGVNPQWHFDGNNADRYSYRVKLLIKYFLFFIKLTDKKIKILHINTGMNRNSLIRDFPLFLISKLFSKKTIIFIHGWKEKEFLFIKSSFIFSFILKLLMSSSNCIFVLSKDFKKKLINYGTEKSKILVSTTMVNTKLYDQKPSSFERKGKVRFLFCAQPIRKEKGIFEFTEILDELLDSDFDIEINFLGDFREVNNLVEKFSSTKYNNKVNFLGYKSGEEKNHIFKLSDILVFPSYTEGLPSTVLEAMAAGLCIVSTPVGGLKDILVNAKNGIIISLPPNSKEIKNSIFKLLNNKDNLNKMRNFNYIISRKKYDSSIVSEKIISVYRKCLL